MRSHSVHLVESVVFGFCVKQDDVVIELKVFGGVCPLVIFSDNFIAEVFCTQDVVHYHFQVMGCARIAVEIDAAGFFQ